MRIVYKERMFIVQITLWDSTTQQQQQRCIHWGIIIIIIIHYYHYYHHYPSIIMHLELQWLITPRTSCTSQEHYKTSSHLPVLVMGSPSETGQTRSPNIALQRMFVAAGRTHLIRKRTGRSMRISCWEVMFINQITIIVHMLVSLLSIIVVIIIISSIE